MFSFKFGRILDALGYLNDLFLRGHHCKISLWCRGKKDVASSLYALQTVREKTCTIFMLLLFS